MGDVIKIDKDLKKRIENLVKKKNNRIKFPSVKNFVDQAVLKFLKEAEDEK